MVQVEALVEAQVRAQVQVQALAQVQVLTLALVLVLVQHHQLIVEILHCLRNEYQYLVV